MSLQEISRDVIPIVQAILTGLGLASVVLLWWQIRGTWKWNKVDAAFRSMDTDSFASVESDALEAAKKLGINLTTLVSEHDAKRIRADRDALLKVKAFAIFLERQAVAFLSGYVDARVFAHTHGRLIRGYAKTLANYISVTRLDTGDPETYVGIERAAEALEKEFQERARNRTGDGVGNRL